MKIIVSAGGTGGHIYPALAICDIIKKHHPDAELLFIGTSNRMEKDIVPKHGIKYEGIEIYGLYRKQIFKNFKTIYYYIKALRRSKKIIKEFQADLVIGAGSYITLPVLKSAQKMGIKTIIHEQNLEPGLANKLLAKKADAVMISFEESAEYFEKSNYTGNPATFRARNARKISKKSLGFDNKKLVCIVMGSLGSPSINNYIYSILDDLPKDLNYLIVTGKGFYKKIKSFPNIKLVEYLDNLPSVLKTVDLLISRSGATTMSEIIELKVPTIFIPSPNVTNNHQLKNAKILSEKHMAVLLEEKNIRNLIQCIKKTINDVKLDKLRNNLKKYNKDCYPLISVIDEQLGINEEVL